MGVNAIFIDGGLQNFGVSVVTLNDTRNSISDLLTIELNSTAPSKVRGVKKSLDDLTRFQSHWCFVSNLISKYNCELAVAEIPAGAKDARASFSFGGVVGLLSCLPTPLIGVSALEAKEAATGFKHSEKEDVIRWAYSKWPDAGWITSKRPNAMEIQTKEGLFLTNKNEHMADSLAIGMAGIRKLKAT